MFSAGNVCHIVTHSMHDIICVCFALCAGARDGDIQVDSIECMNKG